MNTDDIENGSEADDSLLMKVRQHISLIEQMRTSNDAPVDTMGCHMQADKSAPPNVQRFQTLVALMLSSQTKDQVTAAAMDRLKVHNGCTVQNIMDCNQDDLENLIKPVGFYKRKAEYLNKTAKILREQYNDDIPDTLEGLLALPGVGMKMASLALQIAFNKIQGIGVDTHVHRISNRLKWVKTTTPENTEAKLQQILPKNMWNTINKLLVGFGQQTCLPVKPRCSECLVGTAGLCPFYKLKPDKK